MAQIKALAGGLSEQGYGMTGLSPISQFSNDDRAEPVGGTVQAIAAALRDPLSPCKQPRTVEIIAAIPKSTSGNILRRVLKDRVLAR